MSKRTVGAGEEGTSLKRTKVQEAARLYDDANAELFQSRCSMNEIFHLIPIPLLEELFDFLDIRLTTRLYRYTDSITQY